MPYPESCPECGSTFRNTGTHFTARRNEVGRHVLLELGCQNTTRRFWWDFTTGSLTEDGRPSAARTEPDAGVVGAGLANSEPLYVERNGSFHIETNGHAPSPMLDVPADQASMLAPPDVPKEPVYAPGLASIEESVGVEVERAKNVEPSRPMPEPPLAIDAGLESRSVAVESRLRTDDMRDGQRSPEPLQAQPQTLAEFQPLSEMKAHAELENEPDAEPQLAALLGPPPGASASLKDAFVRQLQLDRLTLRQMRSWLMSEEARRAVEVAAGATEATYERLALILFGSELPQLLGKPSAAPQNSGMSAEDRLELQREKARIRARLRRAAAKSARQGG